MKRVAVPSTADDVTGVRIVWRMNGAAAAAKLAILGRWRRREILKGADRDGDGNGGLIAGREIREARHDRPNGLTRGLCL